MAITQFIKKDNTNIGFQPVQQAPSDFTDIVSKSFRSSRDNFVTTSKPRLVQEERDKRNAAFIELSGKDIPSKPFQEPAVTSIRNGFDPQDIAILRQRHNHEVAEEFIRETKIKEPEKYKDILLEDGVVEQARKRANASREAFQQASSRASSFDSIVGSLVGGLGGVATDPINIASLPFGAARGAGILRTVLTEAGINAGAELATQPAVAKWQKEIGQDYGFKEVIENVGFAALFGGTFAGVVKGAKPTATAIYSKLSTMDIKQPGKLAASFMSKVAHIKEATPFIRSNKLLDNKRHVKSVESVSKALDEGKRVDSPDLKITENEFLNIDTSIKKGDTEIIKGQLEEIKRFIENPSEGKIPNTEPEYSIKTLPQQLLDKANSKEGVLTRGDFDDVEIRMLDSAGVKPNKKGIINGEPLVQERNKRLNDDSIQDLTGKEREHIETHLNQARTRSLEDQDLNSQVNKIEEDGNIDSELLNEDVVDPDFMDKVLEKVDSPESIKAEELNFRALAEEKPDLLISLEDGDITLSKLLKDFDKDDNFIKQITSCAIG